MVLLQFLLLLSGACWYVDAWSTQTTDENHSSDVFSETSSADVTTPPTSLTSSASTSPTSMTSLTSQVTDEANSTTMTPTSTPTTSTVTNATSSTTSQLTSPTTSTTTMQTNTSTSSTTLQITSQTTTSAPTTATRSLSTTTTTSQPTSPTTASTISTTSAPTTATRPISTTTTASQTTSPTTATLSTSTIPTTSHTTNAATPTASSTAVTGASTISSSIATTAVSSTINSATTSTVPPSSSSVTPQTPPVTSVTLSGPTVISRLWIEFYCAVATPVNNAQARFTVQFQFNGVTALSVTVNTSSPIATLHESYLHGKLGTQLQCVVLSFWASTPAITSVPYFSGYYSLAVTPSVYWLSVTENDVNPQFVYLQSPLPITCNDAAAAAGAAPCFLAMDIQTANDIAVFQAGVQTPQPCKYLLMENSRPQDSLYLNASQPLAVIAKSDPYVTFIRYSQLVLKFPNLPLKTAGGFKNYRSFWSNYDLSYHPWIYRYDSGGAVLTCTATADVHYQTFDGLFYSSYGSGPFIYSRSTAGQPFEFQARQGPCWSPNDPITCVCGVAMREDNAILILDACQDGILRAIGYNHKNLPKDSGIFASESGYSFKIQMPSGNKVYIDHWGTIMNIRLIVTGRPKIQGMCGSPDGNMNNDLIIRGTSITKLPEAGGWAGPQGPVDVIDSWRPARGKSLFEGYLEPLPTGDHVSGGIVVPPVSTYPLCSYKSNLYNYPSEPSRPVSVLSPKKASASGASRRRRRDADSGVDVDDQYDPSLFTYQDNTTLVNVTWPTRTNITEKEANDTCWSLIVNPANLGPSCINILENSTQDAQDVVTKCVLDVQLTSNFSWARDKVAELQKSCFFNAITKNNSEVNDTNEAIQMAVSDVQQVTNFACVPYDCNNHGSCVNGTCICTADYIGADCKVSKYEPPTIASLLTPTDCDVRDQTCSLARLRAENAASVPTLTCRVGVILRNSSRLSFGQSAQINLAPTVTCSLPTVPLNLTAAYFNFSSVQVPENNFNSLPPGSPVSTYTLSVSNDGVNFSSSHLTMRVIDSLCMDCSSASTTCTQMSNTCLINGYCFGNGDTNPYNSAQTCQPLVSSSQWTGLSSTTSSGNSQSTTSSGTSQRSTRVHLFLLFSVVSGIFRL